MKLTPLLVLGGTVAGFIGVLSFHTRAVTALTASGSTAGTSTPSASAPGPSGKSRRKGLRRRAQCLRRRTQCARPQRSVRLRRA